MAEGYEETSNYSISEQYPKLNKLFTPVKVANHLASWERDVKEEELTEKILRGYNKITKLMVNETWRENQYRLIIRAYIPFLH